MSKKKEIKCIWADGFSQKSIVPEGISCNFILYFHSKTFQREILYFIILLHLFYI